MNIIDQEELLALLGTLPAEGSFIDLETPSSITPSCQGKIEREASRLVIWTRLEADPSLDALRLVLTAEENGWHIQEQIHSGILVNPDASLAKLALEQNLACARLQSSSLRRRAP